MVAVTDAGRPVFLSPLVFLVLEIHDQNGFTALLPIYDITASVVHWMDIKKESFDNNRPTEILTAGFHTTSKNSKFLKSQSNGTPNVSAN